jgi:uncharacterized RDD family membrane protein YckC
MDPQQPGQPPAGAPGSWPPPPPQPGPYAPPPGYPPPPGFYPPPPGFYPPPPGFYPPPPGFAPAYGDRSGLGTMVAITGRTIPTPPGLAVGMEYGGFWVRYAAIGLDFLLVYLLCLLCIFTFIGLFFFWLIPIIYFPFFWSRGQTPGMRICGLKIVRAADGSPIDLGIAVIRFVVMFLEAIGFYLLIGFLGFIWAAFDGRKQAWHDKAAGTVVVHAQLYKAQ